MIAYYGTYDGRAGRAPCLGMPWAPGLAQAPEPAIQRFSSPEEAEKIKQQVLGPTAPAPSKAPTVSIGGVKVPVWNIALAGGVVLGAVAIIVASVAAMERRPR